MCDERSDGLSGFSRLDQTLTSLDTWDKISTLSTSTPVQRGGLKWVPLGSSGPCTTLESFVSIPGLNSSFLGPAEMMVRPKVVVD